MQQPIPVIIDCDPGVDDAHALLMALASPKLDVRAITTVSGNMPIWITTANALRIVELAGKTTPVSAGCSEPLFRDTIEHSELFHGKNGLGNAVVSDPVAKPTGETAVETLRRELEKSENGLHIIALGPLTNIAFLLKLYPGVKSKISHLTVMGGAQFKGNITEDAEFNFYCDAEAADIVMRSGLPITLVDLDGSMSAELTAKDADALTAIPSKISGLIRQMWDFNLELADRFGDSGFVINDSIAVASVIEPSIISRIRGDVRVVTESERYGKSLVSLNERGASEISGQTDRDMFYQMCRTVMVSYPE